MQEAGGQPTDVFVNVTFNNLGSLMISGGSLNTTVLIQQLELLQQNNPAFFAGVTLERVVNIATGASVNVKLCGQGYYSDVALSTCVACPAGTYSSVYLASTSATCTPCPAGSYSPQPAGTSQDACLLCPANTYLAATGSSSSSACTPCTANARSAQGSTSVAMCGCVDGYYDPGDGSCQLCPHGSFCSAGIKNDCSLDGTQSSDAGSFSASQCYCRPGYYYDSTYSSTIYCNLCPNYYFCAGGPGVMPALCPNGAFSGSGASSALACQCMSGYKQLTYGNAPDSNPRSLSISGDQCVCSATTPCGQASITSTNCCQDFSMAYDNSYVCMGEVNGKTSNLTCPQGAVQLWHPDSFYYYANWDQYWYINPPGATSITLTFVNLKTYDINDYLMIYACTPALVCTYQYKVYGSTLPPTNTINSGIVKLYWHTDYRYNSNGFQLTYTSNRACTPLQISQTGSWIVQGLTAAMPLRAWVGDTVDIMANGPFFLSLTTSDGSIVISSSASEIMTQLTTTGVYTLSDSQYPLRSKTLAVSPIKPTTWNIQVTPTGTGVVSYVFSDDVTGTNPDLYPTIGDKLSFTWLTQTNYMVIGNATGTYTPISDGSIGLIGSRTQQITWDTTSAPAGIYYYALQSAPTTPKGKIFLAPRPAGITCVQCEPTEVCYQGNVIQCPANSMAAPGVTASDVSGCLCQPGYYTATTDLLAYANGQNIDTSGRHSCAITQGNLLYCWGANEVGQLGLTWTSTQEPPSLVEGLSSVFSVSLGADFTCVIYAVENRNKTKCWGGNSYGQLARGMPDQGTLGLYAQGDIAPAKLGTDYSVSSAMACADYSCCAFVTSYPPGLSGQAASGVKCWGSGYSTINVNDNMPFLAVSSYPTVWIAHGGSHVCAVQSNPTTGIFVGNVVCWGDNRYGQAGIGSSATTVSLPVSGGLATAVSLTEPAKTVSCYAGVCCAVLKSLGIQCWGRGGDGRLGTGLFNIGSTAATMGSNLPYVELGVNTLAMDINVNGVETCALLANNHVKCWGLVGGQIIQMTEYLPTLQLQENRGVLQMSGRGAATCAVLSNYKAVCWGNNDFGQLGRAIPGVARRRLLQQDSSSSNSVGFNASNMTLVPLPVDMLHSSGTPQSKACAICQDNYYCDGSSSGNAIVQCTLNAISLPQSISSEACHCIDGYRGVHNTPCIPCGGSTYCANGISFACRQNSIAPTYATKAKQCACKPGYSVTDTNACVACPAGTYKEGPGDGPCMPCPPGTNSSIAALENGTLCKACPAGYSTSANAGSIACTQCQAGYFAGTGTADCTQCPAGSWSNQGAGACQLCPAGTYGVPGFTAYLQSCIPCVAGKYSNLTSATASDTCQRCPAGTYSAQGASACMPCPANMFSEEASQTCTACPANSTSQQGSAGSDCTCAAGFMRNGITGKCELCPAGYWAAAGSSACTACPAGTAQPLQGQASPAVCTTCAAGRWSLPGAGICVSCPTATQSSAGASQCSQCQQGYYTNYQVNATGCLPCPLGTYSLTAISSIFQCSTCLLGAYCPGQGSLMQCPSGTFTNRTGNSMLSQCLLCPPGYYCPIPSVKSQCPTGTASPAPGGATSQMACACKPGYACDYSKFLEAVITLNIPASKFSCNSLGQCDVRDAFIAAVAAAANVPAANVVIIQIEDMSGTSTRRRLLSPDAAEGGKIRIHVLVGVRDAERLHELDRQLQSQGLGASVDHGWYTPHDVRVRKASPTV